MASINLGEIADIITGPFGSMLHKSDYRETGIPVIMPQDIGDRTLSLDSIARIDKQDAERLARYVTVENDIVYARRGDVEKHAFITADEAGALCGTGCLRVRVDERKADPLFVSFYLNRPESRMWIRLHAVGSNMPNINTDILSELPMELPDLEVQRKVGNLLRFIDAKIANNEKLMAELEETARLIYDYWFTQFDFPDENGRPYRSNGGTMVWSDELKREIPEGWEAQQVGSLVIANRGVSYSSKNLANTGTPMINLASFSPDYTYNEDGLKHFNGAFSSDKALRPYDLVICNTQQTSLDPAKDIIGKPLLIPDIFESEVISSHHVTTIHVDSEEMKAYLYSLFKTKWFSAYITGYATGTSILGLDPNGLSRLWIPVPSKSLLVAYKSFLMPLEQKKSNLINETSKLKSLRDWMLPMLMNGQLIVE